MQIDELRTTGREHLAQYLCLDVGTVRIGVAHADSQTRIAIPLQTIVVDGTEQKALAAVVKEYQPDCLVIGYPRNQSGEPTQQTAYVEAFRDSLSDLGVQIVFQDESLSSVLAEQYLQASKKPYDKAEIDARAAAIILTDYLEHRHG